VRVHAFAERAPTDAALLEQAERVVVAAHALVRQLQ
jgi:hypothetical protein